MSSVAFPERKNKSVKIWLVIGLILIFGQVVIGGITRLTGSGLSITKWEIVTGTIPPLNVDQWEAEFELYKETPQFQKINQGMVLSEFKFIYFWEFFHRLWARSIGFIFLLPFLVFWRKKRLSPWLMKHLGITVMLTMLVATFGWIMVASGLVDRPWVSAYKLTIHLSLAFLVFGYLFWTTLGVYQPKVPVIHNNTLKKWALWLTILVSIQIMLGGLMSGMKAGLYYPTWPDMNGDLVPPLIFDSSQWTVDNFLFYDNTRFVPALVQTLHRGTAYLLTVMILWYYYKTTKVDLSPLARRSANMLITMLVIQVVLGIGTVMNCVGYIPLSWGVLHQAGGLLLLTAALYHYYQHIPRESY